MGREGEEIHTWNETQMEKSMGKDGYGGKAGKGRREKGNGGKIVDQYLKLVACRQCIDVTLTDTVEYSRLGVQHQR